MRSRSRVPRPAAHIVLALAAVLTSFAPPSYALEFSRADYPAGLVPNEIVAGDLDGDGRPDLMISILGTFYGGGEKIAVLRGLADGAFAPPTELGMTGNAWSMALGDLDDDGDLDLVTANSSECVSAFLGNGDGTFAPEVTYPALTPVAMALGDVDRDGHLDVVTANGGAPHDISVFLGGGDGTLGARIDGGDHIYATCLALGDVDRDGLLDVVTGEIAPNGRIHVMRGLPDATFAAPVSYPVAAGLQRVMVDDLDQDGWLDVVACTFSTLEIRFGGEGGVLGDPTVFPQPGGAYSDVRMGDLDQDGSRDVAAARFHESHALVLRGVGSRTFVPQEPVATGYRPWGIAMADFDGDGWLDLATANHGDNTVSVLLNGGDVVPVQVSWIGSTIHGSIVRSTWQVGVEVAVWRVERRRDQEPWEALGTVMTDGLGRVVYDDASVEPGHRYAYRIMGSTPSGELVSEGDWLDVPAEALRILGISRRGGRWVAEVAVARTDAARLRIRDVQGRRILDRRYAALGVGEHALDLGELNRFPAGVYFLSLEQAGAVTTRRVALH